MIIKKKYIKTDYSDTCYWSSIYKDIISKRNDYEKDISKRSFISLGEQEQKDEQALREREINEFTTRMGFARGQIIMDSSGELFYIVSVKFKGNIIDIKNYQAYIYPIKRESLDKIKSTPSWKLFSDPKTFALYSKSTFAYGITEKNRYENYIPVEVIYV